MRNRSGLLLAALALSAFLTACEEPPSDQDLLAEAKRLAKEGEPEEALDRMRKLVALRPDDPHVQRQYGEALIAVGQPSLAVWPLARAMQDPDEAAGAGVLLARAQLAAGSPDDALQTASRLIGLEPENPAFYELRARAHLLLNMEEAALADVDAAVEHGFDDETTAGFLRVYALLGLGQVEEAGQLLDEIHARAAEEISENPRRAAEVCGATATFAHESGDEETAVERFETCLEGEGLSNRLLVQIALGFFDGIGRYEEGTDILRRRFELDERNLAARVDYAHRLRRSRRAEEGEALLLEATETQPPAWSALVDFYFQRQDFEKALDALEHALASHPDPPDSWRMSKGDFQIILGRLDDAEATLGTIELDVHRAVVAGRLADARGRFEEAASAFEEALRMWPDNPDVRYLAALTYQRMGDWANAVLHLREAARQDPPHVPASRDLVEIQQAMGDSDGRAFVLARLLEVDENDVGAIEGLLEEARAAGSREMARQLFYRFSNLPGMRGRAVADAARMAAGNGGPEKGLRAIEAAKIDLSVLAHFDALEAQSEFLEELGRRDEALANVDRVITARPGAAVFRTHRAKLRLAAGDLAGAREDADGAIRLDPDSTEALLVRGRILAASGEGSLARADFERALSLESSLSEHRAEAAIELARFELAAGEVESGRERLRDVLIERPRNGTAALMLLDSLVAKNEASGATPSSELVDLARRAALFERSPRARDLWSRYGEGAPLIEVER